MKGDVRLRIDGWMPEKLIQRATEMGICLASVERPEPHVIIVETGERDARRLLQLCARFSIPAAVLARRGGSALRRRLRARWTLLPGLLLAGLLCGLFLSRIWRIDVHFTGEAARLGSEAFIREQLAAMGIRPGIARAMDAAALSDELAARAEGYSFAALRVEGVRLLVEAAPEVPEPEVYAVDAPRNLYAARSGIVVSVNVEAGEACVKPGDTVARGQLLIRGAEKRGRDEQRAIGALGEVVIRTWFEGRAEGSLSSAQLRYTGRQSVAARLTTPWLEIPLEAGEAYAQQSVAATRVPVGGLYLPVSIVRETRRETEQVIEAGDRELLSSRLVALSMADARTALCAGAPEDYGILRSWVRYTEIGGDRLRANAVYEIYLNAAATREDIPKGG